MENMVELVANRIYFQVRRGGVPPGIHMDETDGHVYHFHCMDSLYKPVKIRKYFGPVTLSTVHRYCSLVDANLRYTTGRHLYYTNNAEILGFQQKRTNAIFLAGCYLILRREVLPEEVDERLGQLPVSLAPYTDLEGSATHALSLLDCWKALYHGVIVHRWFHKRETVSDVVLSDGNVDAINWVVPDRLIALEDPKEPRNMGRGPRVRSAIVSFFKVKQVEAVVRLNSKDFEFRASYGQPYNADEFACRAIKHYDMFFKDGGIPSETQMQHFLKLVKKANRPVAVHCHAGRGRTGTMLACCLMKFWGFRATQAIAWVRMCRTACIVGIQHDFLKSVENKLRQPEFPVFRKPADRPLPPPPVSNPEQKQPDRGITVKKEEIASAHFWMKRRATMKRRSHRKSSRVKANARKRHQEQIEKVTLLPISSELKRKGCATDKKPQNQLRLVLESHLDDANKSKPKTVESGDKTQFNVKLMKKIHPFYEQQAQKVQYSKSDSSRQNFLTKPVLSSKFSVDHPPTKAKGMDGVLKCQLRTRMSAPCELRQITREIYEEVSNFKNKATKVTVNASKSSTNKPNVVSNTSALERLNKLMNYDHTNGKYYVSDTKILSPFVNDKCAAGSGKSEKGRQKGRAAIATAKAPEKRLAWQESPCDVIKPERKTSIAVHYEFIEKQRQALAALKTAQCRNSGKSKSTRR